MPYDKSVIKDLIEGRLSDSAARRIMSEPKDEDRFDKYLEILQERVGWPERILLPIGERLYIVQKGTEAIVKCECGNEFGDYRVNWKLNALINIRDNEDTLGEIYGRRKPVSSRIGLCEIREYYCPGCGTQLEVESLTPGYPIIFDFLPDLKAFYTGWLGRTLPLEQPGDDKTYETIQEWKKG